MEPEKTRLEFDIHPGIPGPWLWIDAAVGAPSAHIRIKSPIVGECKEMLRSYVDIEFHNMKPFGESGIHCIAQLNVLQPLVCFRNPKPRIALRSSI